MDSGHPRASPHLIREIGSLCNLAHSLLLNVETCYGEAYDVPVIELILGSEASSDKSDGGHDKPALWPV